jgi:hypothetical protein
MLTIDEAFRKFKSRLELNEREEKNAIKRHTEVREYILSRFNIDNDFLTGSYRRHTKTKPLKDIDIFFVLAESQRAKYRDKAPSVVLQDFYVALVDKYGNDAVSKQGRSICIDFGVVVDCDDNTDYKVVSVDVVPAFAAVNDFEIPNADTGKWMKTNPKIHADKATDANKNYGGEWKALVRMVKYWNNNNDHGADKPIKPSFLIEVMCLQLLYGGWGGRFDYEFQALFTTLADRIFDEWLDPAGLGSPISDGMDATRKQRARELLRGASDQASVAIDLARKGRTGDALKAWRKLFGPKFPLS